MGVECLNGIQPPSAVFHFEGYLLLHVYFEYDIAKSRVVGSFVDIRCCLRIV